MPSVDVRRDVRASPERVWAAWTTSAGLASWWWRHWNDVRHRIDARPGGDYRIEADGAGIGVRGDVVDLDPTRRLELTWVWLERDDAGGWQEEPPDRVEVVISPTDDGARVDVHHEDDTMDDEQAAAYREGWTAVLDALADSLADVDGQRSA